MRILLVNTPYYYAHAMAMRLELLGVLYLASTLRALGHRVSILDPAMEKPKKVHRDKYYYGICEEEMRKKIAACDPDIIGISCHYAFSYKEAYKIAALAKEIKPEVIVVVGGLFASIYKEKLLIDCASIDYALMGESEQSFSKLLSCFSSKGNPSGLDKIDGLLYRAQNKVMHNDKKFFIEDLDELPFPARDLIDIKRYMNLRTILYGLGDKPALSLLTSRSCPYRCSFCNMRLVHGPKWRARSAENVLAEIDQAVNKYKAEHIFVMDDNFTFDPARAKAICSGIIQKEYRFRWNTPNGISVKRIDAELTHLMKRSGCANVCIGIESGSEYIRNEVMNKNVTNEEIINAVEHFNSAKIPVGGFVLLGMPGENEKYFHESLNFLKRLKLSFIAISFVIPFPGTKLHADLLSKGIIDGGYLPQMDNFNYPVFTTEDFSEAELLRRRKELFLKFYLNHSARMAGEFFKRRLNWITLGMLKRILSEKI